VRKTGVQRSLAQANWRAKASRLPPRIGQRTSKIRQMVTEAMIPKQGQMEIDQLGARWNENLRMSQGLPCFAE
jgi:hypothetical protein